MNDPTPCDDAFLALRDKIIERLRTVYDPEIPVNLYDLGLIYRIELLPVEGRGLVDLVLDMTLTSVGCPMADEMPGMIKAAIDDLDEINSIKINLVWDPPWDKSRLSEEARLMLNLF